MSPLYVSYRKLLCLLNVSRETINYLGVHKSMIQEIYYQVKQECALQRKRVLLKNPVCCSVHTYVTPNGGVALARTPLCGSSCALGRIMWAYMSLSYCFL